ncbi:unnamed protein product [Orchesella dallaii]|uniref:AMP-dependent synthetase/ligase domain-containing protein n=1 Tax=Orchesella dallaii TaxID=48710 RepID=A0ABP1PMC6_9HEXA
MEDNIIYSSFQSISNELDQYNNMAEALLKKAKEHAQSGKGDWITCALTGESYDFSSFDDLTRRIGSALYKRGLRKGDIVIFMTVDIVKKPMFITGVWRANGIGRASYPEDDAETLLARVFESRCGWIYCEPAQASLCLSVAEQIYWDVEVIVASREPVEGCTTIYELMEDDGSELPELNLGLDETALIMCTSGTTGMSKAK